MPEALYQRRHVLASAVLVAGFIVIAMFVASPQHAAAPNLAGGGPAHGSMRNATDAAITILSDTAVAPGSLTGSTWHAFPAGGLLSGVHFVSSTVGYVSGIKNTLLMTLDGGTTWAYVGVSGTEVGQNSFHFNDATTGWIVGGGGSIQKTTNGLDWTAQTSGTAAELRSVMFVGDTGYAVGVSGVIVATTNGGTTWTAQTSGVATTLTSVYCSSASTCVIVGDSGVILRTTNSGTAWSSVTSGTAADLQDIDCSGSTCIVAGASGTMLRSTDSGATWSSVTSGTANVLWAVDFATAATGFSVGDSGTVLKTTDTGVTWSPFTSGVTKALYEVSFMDANTGWAVGDGGLGIKTTNGGTTWTVVLDNATTLGSHALDDMVFANATMGWRVGGTTATTGGVIMGTTDGGEVWAIQVSGIANAFEGVDCASTTACWAVGLGGIIYATTNGSTWTAQTSGTVNDLYAVQCSDASTCIVFGGGGGTILTTTNGGTTWTARTSGAEAGTIFYDALCPTASVCYAVGTVPPRKTTDGGTTWVDAGFGVATTVYGVHCIDVNTCWLATSGGGLHTTTNGGTTWTSRTTGTAQDLNTVIFSSDGYGWAAGQNGTLLKTTDNGATWAAQTIRGAAYTPIFASFAAVDDTHLWLVDGGPSAATVFVPGHTVTLQENSSNTQGGSAAGPDLCTRVTLTNSGQTITCVHGTLPDKQWHTFTAAGGASGVRSTGGDAMVSSVTRSFYVEDVSAIVGDTTPPATPTSAHLEIMNAIRDSSGESFTATLKFDWDDPPDADLTQIRVLAIDGQRTTLLGTVGAGVTTLRTQATLPVGKRSTYAIQAVDANGNRSAFATSTLTFIMSAEAPVAPPDRPVIVMVVEPNVEPTFIFLSVPSGTGLMPREQGVTTTPTVTTPSTTTLITPTPSGLAGPGQPIAFGALPAPVLVDVGSVEGNVHLSWHNPSGVVLTAVEVLREDASGTFVLRRRLGPTETSFFNDSEVLDVGKTYRYGVRVVARDGRISQLAIAGIIVRGVERQVGVTLDVPAAVLDIVAGAPCTLSALERRWIADSFTLSQGRSPTIAGEDLAFLCALRIDPREPSDLTGEHPELRNPEAEARALEQFAAFFGRQPARGFSGEDLSAEAAESDWRAVEYFAYAPRIAPTNVDVKAERACMRLFTSRAFDITKDGIVVRKAAGVPPQGFGDYEYIRACRYSRAVFNAAP